MRWCCVALVVGSLAGSACDRHDRSHPERQTTLNGAIKEAGPDQPLRSPFPTASEVRLFVNTGFDEKGKPVFSNPQGHALTAAQQATFESLIKIHTIAPSDVVAFCFIPHHFFRYFDRSGRQVGEFQVCFCCGGVEESGALRVHLTEKQKLSADFGKLTKFVEALGEPTKVQCHEG